MVAGEDDFLGLRDADIDSRVGREDSSVGGVDSTIESVVLVNFLNGWM